MMGLVGPRVRGANVEPMGRQGEVESGGSTHLGRAGKLEAQS